MRWYGARETLFLSLEDRIDKAETNLELFQMTPAIKLSKLLERQPIVWHMCSINAKRESR
jgi:hypothetical protein